MTALIAASANGQFFVVKALLENKSCDINLQNRNGVNALIAASCGGHLSIVNLLVNKKCDLDGQSFDGNSALMDAFQKGHIAIAVALTNAGCNANLVNKKGRTAMEILINRHPSLVASFHDALDASEHGVNASAASKSEKRKIEMISNPTETVKRKIVMTSNPTPTSVSDGERPRAYTTYGPSVHRYDCDEDEENVSHKNKKVKEVISVSPGPVIVNISDKASSFIAATRSGDFNQVKNALKANPDLINCTDRDGMTALVWASMKNYMDIVELLLTYEDCQLDHQDRFGTTGLILACCSGHIEIAVKLLRHACDHTVRDGKGKSAYDYLRSYHPTKCTSFLDALKVNAAMSAWQ